VPVVEKIHLIDATSIRELDVARTGNPNPTGI